MKQQLDVLVFGAHPDDAELFCGGTICALTSRGYRVGIIDLTRGELGSRGSAELRQEEGTEAARIAGIDVRENLEMPDGNIENTTDNRHAIIRAIRRYRPGIIIANALECRHPDHGAAAAIVKDCVFYAGLRKIETDDDGGPQHEWRPDHLLHYVQAVPFEPSLVVDVTDVWPQRMEAVGAFKSQFFDASYEAKEGEPETFISSPEFLKTIEARARMHGQRIGVEFGEGFRYSSGPVGVSDLVATLGRKAIE